eukprot:6537338-Pyramimonas_sp.AAC.1
MGRISRVVAPGEARPRSAGIPSRPRASPATSSRCIGRRDWSVRARRPNRLRSMFEHDVLAVIPAPD